MGRRLRKAASTLHCPPDLLRGCGAGEDHGVERRERVCDGVGAGFAAAFDAEPVGRAAGALEAEGKGGEVVGAGHRVIHKRAGNYRAFIPLVCRF
jgi:hypothetical protein